MHAPDSCSVFSINKFSYVDDQQLCSIIYCLQSNAVPTYLSHYIAKLSVRKRFEYPSNDVLILEEINVGRCSDIL